MLPGPGCHGNTHPLLWLLLALGRDGREVTSAFDWGVGVEFHILCLSRASLPR